MKPAHTNALLSRTRLLLFSLGVLCALYIALAVIPPLLPVKAARAFAAQTAARPNPQSPMQAAPASINLDPETTGSTSGSVMGRLEIPAIALSVPILSDYQSSSLLKGIGYIPGTARPGGLGTLGLAGHRDTYFRPLRNIKPDMDIRVSDQTGTYHYQVDSTEVVTPADVRVLAIRRKPELTLITCYPFNYIGAAPKRFIVHAHLLSALPD